MPLFGSLPWVVFFTALPILVERFYLHDKNQDYLTSQMEMEADFGLPKNETFDFIIVGAGTSGSILARRLSEHHSVLLLEAGGDPLPVDTIPSVTGLTSMLPDVHWLFKTTANNSVHYNGGTSKMTAGKNLGGSGSINNLHWERGSPYDYQRWANVTGDDSWLYDNVLPYFKRIENYKGQFSNATEQHGYAGLIDVVSAEVPFKDDLFFKAGEEMGYAVRLDPNGPQKIGFSPVEYNRRNGSRVSAFTEYLKPIMGKRKNLKVLKYSVVTKVILENLRATGVHYSRHGVPRVAFASKEVILSAGAFVSPMILMRSGIGPSDQLALIKKEQLLDLPVGHHLQTHPMVNLYYSFNNKSVFKYLHDRVTFADFEEYKTNRTGFLVARDSYQEAFFASNRAVYNDTNRNWADLQLRFRQFLIPSLFTNVGEDVITCEICLSRPRSTGRLLVNADVDADTDKPEELISPIVDYELYIDESDYDVYKEGYWKCKDIEKTASLQEFGARLILETMPECDIYSRNSTEYWKCYIKNQASANVHDVGTCRMGSKNDTSAVVDTKMRVLGTESLRVVDSSVMPFITNANVNAVVMMIAEKTSDDILQHWQSV